MNDPFDYYVLVHPENGHRLVFLAYKETHTVYVASLNSLGIPCAVYHLREDKWYDYYITFVLESARTFWLDKVKEGYRMENIKPSDLTAHEQPDIITP